MVPISEPLAQSPVDPVDVEQPVADMDSALAAQSYTKTTQTSMKTYNRSMISIAYIR